MRGTHFLAAASAVVLAMLPLSARAGVTVKVDLTRQQMKVEVDGNEAHAWPVSTARSGYATPTGTYTPQRMHRMWFSKKYDNSPMPHAIFYSGGFAIHGTGSVRMLGQPASHGCVRLAPSNAAALYALVQQKGMGATKIVITGSPPRSREPVVAHRASPRPGSSGKYRVVTRDGVAGAPVQASLFSSLFTPASAPAMRPPASRR